MTKTTDIPKGYKDSPLGVIPEDWEVKRLGAIGDVKMCKRIFKEQTSTNPDGIPFYKIGTFGNSADAFISKELFNEYRKKYSYPNIGDILISAAGTIGRLVVFDGQPSYFQDSNIVWIDNAETIVTNKYLYYLYGTIRWRTTEGGIVSRIYNSDIKKTKIALPPLPEQKKIAEILSTWDITIEKQNELITNSNYCKRGLMQQLLTAKNV